MVFSTILLQWYCNHKRDLPWRESNSPFYIWVSEIIMQQTRVDQGTPYYYNFIKTFPNIESLAKANIDQVLRVWQGLGYYSRARNMHKAAIKINQELKNKFPKNYYDLKGIPGIGDYTAAAIASICYNEKVPAIDGNLNRVISRLYDIAEPVDRASGKKQILDIMNEAMLTTNKPGDLNQALMDFGSAICTPKNTACVTCCLSDHCLSFHNKTVSSRPVKALKTKSRTRYFYYIYIQQENNTLLNRREEKDIWQGLYEFPLIETDHQVSVQEILSNKEFKSLLPPDATISIDTFKQKPHILSHQVIKSTFIKVKTNQITKQNKYLEVNTKGLDKYAFPKLITQFLMAQ